jgi:hypothetical protein
MKDGQLHNSIDALGRICAKSEDDRKMEFISLDWELIYDECIAAVSRVIPRCY